MVNNTRKVFAVIDTNVLVSALISQKADSATVLVLQSFFEGKLLPLYNDEIISEYRDVLNRKKFHFPQTQIEDLISSIITNGIETSRTQSQEKFPDSKDIPFYEVALTRSTDDAHLVTGNTKHFPQKLFVVTPAEMIKILHDSETTVK